MPPRTVIFVDGGTTQTRAWAVRGDEVLGHARAQVGARDTARDGSPARLRAAVRDVVAQAAAGCDPPPALVVAAGMITSPQGLCEVPHVEAPAGAAALAAGARLERLPDVTPLPVLFVPGVRSGPSRCDADSVRTADIMRGEEVLALGLAQDQGGRLARGGVFLNLGSHWKAIRVDGAGRIAGSVSTLSGELVHAVQTQTILASALPRERPATLDPGFCAAGRRASAAGGLARALYCVRLLEQRADATPEQRLAFLLGAAIAADRAALVPDVAGPVVVVGAPALAEAWAAALRDDGIEATVVGEPEVERAFRAGCLRVLEARGEP